MDHSPTHSSAKRKQENEDPNDVSSSTDPVPPPENPSCAHPSVTTVKVNSASKSPRRLKLSKSDNKYWMSPASPQVANPAHSPSKRPRIEAIDARPRPRRSARLKAPPVHNSVDSLGDIGIVPKSNPPPSTSGLQLPDLDSVAHVFTDASQLPVDYFSPHIAPMDPLITRRNLKELELDIILRNAVIRHDLMFDCSLGFKPQKYPASTEQYWRAVWHEVETGCTCVTLDTKGQLHDTICVCHRYQAPPVPISAQLSPSIYTLRLPSRLSALLIEFLEVMVYVIQPLSNTKIYTDPAVIREQAEEHSAHAAYLRSFIDPELIAQEIKYRLYHPKGHFVAIGQILKQHCAPMRDAAVNEIVQIASQAGPDSFRAVRKCLELLENMKLDIANHQLHQIRPWLIRNTGQFEMKALKLRFCDNPSLHNTRAWLHGAHERLKLLTAPIYHPNFPDGLDYPKLNKNHKVYLSTLKALVDLIFDDDNLSKSGSLTDPNDDSQIRNPDRKPFSFPLNGIAETLHLDKSRISHMSLDAVDLTALYMFILLFRQLVYSSVASDSVKIPQRDVMSLKREIEDLGPSTLGVCFLSTSDQILESSPKGMIANSVENQRLKYDVVLQVARRATEARHQSSLTHFGDINRPEVDSFDLRMPVEPAILNLAKRWADTNLHHTSSLSSLIHERVRDAVFESVVYMCYPPKKEDFDVAIELTSSTITNYLCFAPPGMEALSDDIRLMSMKISRLALVHFRPYLNMYETGIFFSDN